MRLGRSVSGLVFYVLTLGSLAVEFLGLCAVACLTFQQRPRLYIHLAIIAREAECSQSASWWRYGQDTHGIVSPEPRPSKAKDGLLRAHGACVCSPSYMVSYRVGDFSASTIGVRRDHDRNEATPAPLSLDPVTGDPLTDPSPPAYAWRAPLDATLDAPLADPGLPQRSVGWG